VNPVTANSSMPIRQMAELIQCHSCNFLSQYARCGALEEAAVIQNFLGLHRRRAEPTFATSRHKARPCLHSKAAF
jgi:hypothetical protein